MIAATRVSKTRAGAYTHIYRFTFPSVGAGGTSDEVKFQLDEFPIILAEKALSEDTTLLKEFKISCDSDDYDISLRRSEGATLPSIDEIYKVQDIVDNTYFDNQVSIIYNNTDHAIYGVLTNADGVNSTGVVTVEFTVEALK